MGARLEAGSLWRGRFPCLALFLLAAACGRGTGSPRAAGPQRAPTVRVMFVSSVAGALEPCGCRADMLGGLAHAGALVATERLLGPHSLLVASGPLLFEDPELAELGRTQALWKAEALATGFRELGLAAWAPGANDWAGGTEFFGTITAARGLTALASGVSTGEHALRGTATIVVNGVTVGLAGVSDLGAGGALPAGVAMVKPPEEALRAARAELEQAGAGLRIALVAAPRRVALQLAEQVAGFDLFVVSPPRASGEAALPAAPPELVGGALVAETPNHLQALGIADFFVEGGSFDFTDATGLERQANVARLGARLRGYEERLAALESPSGASTASPEDVARLRASADALRAELGALAAPAPPPAGSTLRYSVALIDPSAGSEPRIAEQITAYYRRVNEHNRTAFASLLPPPAPPGTASFVGVEACAACHAPARAFWATTRHAKAYASLVAVDKQFNLDCVGCHVTGYGRPGGSTVTHVERLEGVQCEVCHGAGSLHVEKPRVRGLVARRPADGLCAEQCHNAPHVPDDWSAARAMARITGPGHGQ